MNSVNKLVFIKDFTARSTPYTTHEIIAECAQVKPKSVAQLIRYHEKDLQYYGQVTFEMSAVQGSKGTNEKKIYHLNEQQATLLITYLKNTKPVREFKKELVRQFFAMREELFQHRMIRPEQKKTRRSLTDAIKESPAFGSHGYKHLTDLAYKAVTGKNAAQIKKEHGAGKGQHAIDLLTTDELMAYQRTENIIAALVDVGMDYQQIKQTLLKTERAGA